MSDVAAKREARRQKILLNSQNRLQKITGRVCESPIEGPQVTSQEIENRLFPRVERDFDDNSRQPAPPGKKSFVHSPLFSLISYPLLALIVNILILLNFDHIFGKTIMTPFSAMIIAHVFFHERWSKPQEANMLVAALLLCNMHPKVISRLRKVASTCKIIIQGFILYFLSFIIIRWIFSLIWNEPEITFPEYLTIPD